MRLFNLIITISILNALFLINCGGVSEDIDDQQPDDQQIEVDSDGDGLVDESDNCPDDSNASQLDEDGDGVGDVCDNCIGDQNVDQADSDEDGIGDVCDGPGPSLCESGVTECFNDDDCGQNKFCKNDGCCADKPDESQTFSCDDPEAHPFANCEDLALFAGANEDNKDSAEFADIDCDLFGLRGTCLHRDPNDCCGIAACQYALGVPETGISIGFVCDAWSGPFSDYIPSPTGWTCETFRFALPFSPECQTTSDPRGILPDQDCCVPKCATEVFCTLPTDERDPDVVCQEDVHMTSTCDQFSGCCKEACNEDSSKVCPENACTPPEICRDGCCQVICGGDLSKECGGDGDCSGGEVCNNGCCGSCLNTCTDVGDCPKGEAGSQCIDGCCRPL